MQKVLIVSDALETCNELKRIIEAQLPYQVFTAYDDNAIRAQITSKVFNLVILDLAIVEENVFRMINTIDECGYSYPLVISTFRVNTGLFTRLINQHDAHILIRPITEKNIVGLIKKVLTSRKVPKQVNQRFNTNQMAEIESLSAGNNLMTSMYNLSKGGAYCEFDSPNSVTVGDLIRLKVVMNDTSKEYTFNAKVVWTTARGRFSGRFGCGFKFVSGRDVYGGMRF